MKLINSVIYGYREDRYNTPVLVQRLLKNINSTISNIDFSKQTILPAGSYVKGGKSLNGVVIEDILHVMN